jgi:hypothetical protein
MTTNEQPDAFTGWLREGGGRWRQAVTGPDAGTCFARLMAVGVTAKSVERLVLPRGRTPRDRRTR